MIFILVMAAVGGDGMNASEKPTESNENTSGDGASWGPKIFWLTLLVILVFFWWLLIYSHGIEPTHN